MIGAWIAASILAALFLALQVTRWLGRRCARKAAEIGAHPPFAVVRLCRIGGAEEVTVRHVLPDGTLGAIVADPEIVAIYARSDGLEAMADGEARADADRLQNLDRLSRASTAGEWCIVSQGKDQDSGEEVACISSELEDGSRKAIVNVAHVGGGHVAAMSDADARFIVAAKSEIRWLIAMARRAAS